MYFLKEQFRECILDASAVINAWSSVQILLIKFYQEYEKVLLIFFGARKLHLLKYKLIQFFLSLIFFDYFELGLKYKYKNLFKLYSF